jgi:ferredoxin-NADP reductase
VTDPAPVAVGWLPATLVSDRMESSRSRTLLLDAPGFPPTTAGQHLDIRLSAPDGYTAQRSYSISSGTGVTPIEVTVDLMPEGEVSPYLVQDLAVGDAIEVRGPIGGWFVWRAKQTEPVQLIAGGSGIAPVMAMIRTHAATGSAAPFRLLYSVRAPDNEFYRAELDELVGPALTVDRFYTRTAPAGWARPPGRVTAADLAAVTLPPAVDATVYVCGPTAFVESVSQLLLTGGHPAERIRTERFGPTG